MVNRQELSKLLEIINQDTHHPSYDPANIEDIMPGKIFSIKTAPSTTSTQQSKTCAMKVVAYEASDDTIRHNRKMLQRMQDFDHPNIIRIFDQDTHMIGNVSYFWFSMEYGSARSLDDPSTDKKIAKYDTKGSINIIRQIANGLEYVHKRRFTHRDLKPSNIIMCNGVPKINDFEDLGSQGTQSTNSQAIRGTPQWRAPEADLLVSAHRPETKEEEEYWRNALSEDKDTDSPGLRSKPTLDLFALGTIFTQLSTQLDNPQRRRFGKGKKERGKLISENEYYGVKRNTEELAKHLRLDKVNNKALESIIKKLLEYDSVKLDANRYQTIEEFLFDLSLVGDEDYKEHHMYYEYFDDIYKVLDELDLDKIEESSLEEVFKKFSELKEKIFSKYEGTKNSFVSKIHEYQQEKNREDKTAEEFRKALDDFKEQNKEIIELIENESEVYDYETETKIKEYLDELSRKEHDVRKHEFASKEEFFGSVVDIVEKGTQDSEIIHELKKAINEKHDECVIEITEFIGAEKTIEKRFGWELSDIQLKVQKYQKFAKCAKEYNFNREKLLNDLPVMCSLTISDLESDLDGLADKYKGYLPEPVIAGEITDEEKAEAKIQEYKQELLKAEKAFSEQKENPEYADRDPKELQRQYENYKTFIDNEISKVNAIVTDAEQRCSIAKTRYYNENMALPKAVEVFNFADYPDEELVKTLGKHNVPIYDDFKCVKAIIKNMELCETGIQKIWERDKQNGIT